MEKKRISLSIPADLYDRLEDIKEKRQPMSGLISDILQYHAENHGNILTKDEHMAIIGKKDSDFREMRDDRNNIASINRVLQSTIEDLREENAPLREKVNGRRIFGRGPGK